jgi:hypothetical protein
MKDVIELARESGFTEGELAFMGENFLRFAELVRKDERERAMRENAYVQAEREACAKVCDELIAPALYGDADKSMWDVTCMDCAAAIRNRGQA